MNIRGKNYCKILINTQMKTQRMKKPWAVFFGDNRQKCDINSCRILMNNHTLRTCKTNTGCLKWNMK